MQITVTLCLPRDAATLPLVRHIAVAALTELGVEREAIDDVALALTEASANVVKHSGADDLYEVHLTVEGDVCEIRVVDTGRGFDTGSHPTARASPSDEKGRGLGLITALVDSVQFESRPEAGTVVRLVKDLPLRPDSALRRLASP